MSDIYTYVLTDDEYPSTCVLFRPDVSPEAVHFGARERSADEYQYDDPPDWFAPRFTSARVQPFRMRSTSRFAISTWQKNSA